MTIYFTRDNLNRVKVKEGDYWYIYFTKDSYKPVIGVITKVVWEDLFTANIDSRQRDEEKGEYSIPVTKLNICREEPPEKLRDISVEIKERKAVTPEEAARIEQIRKVKGNRGEEIALEIEKQRLVEMGREDLLTKLIPVAKTKDGLGYDIVSTDIDSNGNEYDIFIEVKATSGDKESPFFVTKRELEISRERKEYYYLYRLYELKKIRIVLNIM